MHTYTMVTAHSGCQDTKRDSLDSVKIGIALGADAIEVDVRQSAQGELVLSHDAKPEGYAGFSTLRQAMELVAPSPAILNCDIKEAEAIPPVLALADEFGIGPKRLILTGSVKPQMLLQTPGILQRAHVWLNIEELLYWYTEQGKLPQKLSGANAVPHPFMLLFSPDIQLEKWVAPVVADCERLGVMGLNMPTYEGTGQWIEAFMQSGTSLSVWTVNERDEMERFMRMGVANLTTLRPAQAVQIRNALQGGSA